MDTVQADERIKEAVRDAYGDIARRFVDEGAGEEQSQSRCCGPTEAAAEHRSGSGCCDLEASSETKSGSGCCEPAEASSETKSGSGCCEPAEASSEIKSGSGCCGSSEAAADCLGSANRLYPAEELDGLPDSVTGASLGCGNPLAIAGLQPGEVVLDLGSGGGIDCFLAARRVGPEGQVIGLDMTPDMIKLARRNAKKLGVTNVDFRYGEMEEMPLPDESVDVVISNCVINLSPDKGAVFAEAYRVLRPGGRLSISDIVIDGDLPQAIRDRLDAWAGCIAGALDEVVYLDKIRAVGFENVDVLSRDVMTADEISDAESQMATEANVSVQELVQKVASIKVNAYKP